VAEDTSSILTISKETKEELSIQINLFPRAFEDINFALRLTVES
jgi:hypothetical protein